MDLTEPVKTLLAAMAESADQKWQHATLAITTDRVEATFDYPTNLPETPMVDIDLPALAKPDFDLRPLGPDSPLASTTPSRADRFGS